MKRLTGTLNIIKKLGILTAFSLFLTFSGVKASHLVGGELNYKWISGNDYLITLKLYRDCSGIPNVGTTTIEIYSSCYSNQTATLSLTSGPSLITPVCASQLSNTTCGTGTLYGVEQYTYSGQVTLQGQCTDWTFYWNECCRNAGITNLVNPSGYGMYLSAKLDNWNAPNNSCQFMYPPLTVIKIDTTTINWSAVDIDGDSLSYQLTSAKDDSTGTVVSIPYSSPATYNNPLFASDPAIFDATTGILTISPNVLQVAVVTMVVSEYRNGIKIGEVSRDCQILVVSTTNNLPELSGINGSNTFIHTACPGDTINFNVFSFDSDSSQYLVTHWDSAFSGPVITSNYSQNPTTNFYWVVDSSNLSSQPYLLTLKVEDDNCPYTGVQYYTYKIYVRPCNSIPVWPGDADLNMVADVYDLLPIGIANGITGPVRSSASTNWLAQPSNDWPQSFVSGINYKNADCNGNGIIDLNDTNAILLNYGQVHTLRNASVSSTTSFGLPNIYLVANVDTTGINTVIYYDVVLGDSLIPINNIYGLAFSLQFNIPSVIGGVSISYFNSFMGNPGVDLFKLEKVFPNYSQIDIGLTGINHNNQSGFGTVARIGVVITDNISGRGKFYPVITNTEGVTADEAYLDFGRVCDTIVIDPLFTGIKSSDLENQISIYPNPANNKVVIETGFSKMESIWLTDQLGRTIHNISYLLQNNNKATLNISDLNNGIYYARIITDNGIAIKKLIVAKPLIK